MCLSVCEIYVCNHVKWHASESIKHCRRPSRPSIPTESLDWRSLWSKLWYVPLCARPRMHVFVLQLCECNPRAFGNDIRLTCFRHWWWSCMIHHTVGPDKWALFLLGLAWCPLSICTCVSPVWAAPYTICFIVIGASTQSQWYWISANTLINAYCVHSFVCL